MRLRFINPAASSTEENYLLPFLIGQQNEFIILGPLAKMFASILSAGTRHA
jgi:hypothetical protein